MSNHDRVTEIYDDLRKRGIVRNLKDLSELLDVSYTNFTQAMKGDPMRLTPSLMSKVEALYASYNPDSIKPLQKPEDQIRPGSIVIPPELAQMFTDLAATIRSQQQTIERLTSARTGDGLSEKSVG